MPTWRIGHGWRYTDRRLLVEPRIAMDQPVELDMRLFSLFQDFTKRLSNPGSPEREFYAISHAPGIPGLFTSQQILRNSMNSLTTMSISMSSQTAPSISGSKSTKMNLELMMLERVLTMGSSFMPSSRT